MKNKKILLLFVLISIMLCSIILKQLYTDLAVLPASLYKEGDKIYCVCETQNSKDDNLFFVSYSCFSAKIPFPVKTGFFVTHSQLTVEVSEKAVKDYMQKINCVE